VADAGWLLDDDPDKVGSGATPVVGFGVVVSARLMVPEERGFLPVGGVE
jgi:hypothetical protein